jgi:hypothetical protein
MFRDGQTAPCKRTVSGSNPLTGSTYLQFRGHIFALSGGSLTEPWNE